VSCNELQCLLQCICCAATATFGDSSPAISYSPVCDNALKCLLQCVAECRRVSQCVAVCRSVSQCVAVCCYHQSKTVSHQSNNPSVYCSVCVCERAHIHIHIHIHVHTHMQASHANTHTHTHTITQHEGSQINMCPIYVPSCHSHMNMCPIYAHSRHSPVNMCPHNAHRHRHTRHTASMCTRAIHT